MYGIVVVSQVPMFFTFDEAEALYVVESLAHSLEQSYKILDFFTDRELQEGEEW
jgi:hypothetical protein